MNQPGYFISALGDSALLIDFGNVIDQTVNKRVLAVMRSFQHAAIVGVLDLVPAYSSLTVHYEIFTILHANKGATAFEIMKEKTEFLLLKKIEEITLETKKVRIPVCYAPHYGWDVDEIARQVKLNAEEIILLHTSKTYRVYMVGFLPGFAYMGEVDERIALPRKATPRLQIPRGSVGIAGKQTGIYPLPSPGGWQIIGRTPLKLFDRYAEEPVLLSPGDEVEFYSISENEFINY